MAAKAMTQAQVIEKMSDSEGLTKAQVKKFFNTLTVMALKEAKNGFPVPGMGKLVIVSRKARKGRNPATGESIKIPAKKSLKFRISKSVKDAIAGVKTVPAVASAPKKAKAVVAVKKVKVKAEPKAAVKTASKATPKAKTASKKVSAKNSKK